MFEIRPIRATDDPVMAEIIRKVMTEHGASGQGFAIHDPEVVEMSKAYSAPRHAYFVVELSGKVIGGGGVAPLKGADESVCELRKMYFLPEARGFGAGKRLLLASLETAKELGFKTCYLETLETMETAKKLYEKVGFKKISAPMGSTGHFGCDAWYTKEL